MPPKQKKQKVEDENEEEAQCEGSSDTETNASPSAKDKESPPADATSLSPLGQKFLDLEAEQCKELLQLQYGQGQLLVYNPLDYAAEIHRDFVSKCCQGPKKVLLLGMNPGPWGMGQTGVPFGHVEYARDWLEVKGEVTKPSNEHAKRPITGLQCTRKEVSGDRMWSLLKQLSGTPEVLFKHVFLYNYCPIFFLKDSARNITPPDLKVKEREALEAVCNKTLIRVVELLGVDHVVGVGTYATDKACEALTEGGREDVEVSTLMHPSPINPAANKGWAKIAIKQLTESKNLLELLMINMKITHKMSEAADKFMQEAFEQAREALVCNEVPVGCVFVYDGVVVGQGRNTVNATRNATRHAEMNCIDRVLEWCGESGLDYEAVFKKVSVYVTVEPCGMCADALGQLCVDSVIFGCSNDRFGGCGSVIDVPKLYDYPIHFIKGIRLEEAIELLKEFYKGENPNAPTAKVKRKTAKH